MENLPDKAVNDHLKTLEYLKEIRRPFESQIDDIIKYIYHGRRAISDPSSTKGKGTGQHIYDGTALSAVNLLTDGLTGYTISKSFKWFGYSLPNKINFSRTSALRSSSGRRLDSFPEVKLWLEETEEAMNSAFLSSNIYDIAPEFVRDAATIGTSTMNADEDILGGRTIFTVSHFRENFIAENYFGLIDTNFREYKLSLKQLSEKFGYDHMVSKDPKFERDFKKNHYLERDIVHARYPRKDFDPQKMDGKNKPFASVWMMTDPKVILKESGTTNQSFVTWRWRKNSDEWYGRSPAWDAYVDVMTSHQMGKSNLIGGQKMVNPPMVGPEDLRGAVQRSPGGWTNITDPNNIPRPLQEGIQLPFTLNMQDRIDQKIREHFNVEFFTVLTQAALNGAEMTAYQASEIAAEKAATLGPRIGRMETEGLNPIHDLIFNIEKRAGRIPPPPDILQEFSGGAIEIEYLGPLAQAQKKIFRGQGIRQGLDSLGLLGQMFPEVMDLINPDETARDVLRASGFPQKDIHTEDTVKEIRAMKQQAAQEQAEFEQTIATAKAMPAAGKEISPDSAAGMLLGGSPSLG